MEITVIAERVEQQERRRIKSCNVQGPLVEADAFNLFRLNSYCHFICILVISQT